MSINGVLEDLPLSDVLQFVHLGRRTGTLYMWRDDDHRAEIGFHEGRIVSAWAPGQKRLGDLLVGEGVIDVDALETALLYQRTEGSDQSIGQILLARDLVTRDDVHRVIKEQIQETIFELVTWQEGHFHFEVDELNPIDDFALAPGELFGDLDLNTQMLLLEATRIFDERHKSGVAPPPITAPPESELDRHLQRAGLGRTPPPGFEARAVPTTDVRDRRVGHRRRPATAVPIRCQVVSADPALVEALEEDLPRDEAQVAAVKVREVGNRLPGEVSSPVVVLDLRGDSASVDDVAALARTRPGAPVLAVVGEEAERSSILAAGAVAAVVPEREAVVAGCRNLIRVLSRAQAPIMPGPSLRGGFSRFRRVVFDVQSGLLSATMALNLMHVISESVERAVLFLVQRDQLIAVGAFGFSSGGRPLAEVTRRFSLRPEEGSALRRAVEGGEPLSVDFDEANLDPELARTLGRPASGQVVIFPVQGAERTIAVIYTDNGTLEDEIQDIRILELATSQVGVALENELLRQQLGGRGLEVAFE